MTKKTGKIKHYFAGGNTGDGFYSYYEHIIGHDANRLFILKGGPGTGKSTFMLKIGEELITRGFELEYFHCSSAPNSLDGLAIPALKVALIDGTAPHTIDPIFPGIVDEIINLGMFWDEATLNPNKEQIKEISKKKKSCFERAYVYLAAAKGVYQNWYQTNFSCLSEELWLKTLLKIKEEIFYNLNPTGKLGSLRHLFASAITADGPINYLESIFNDAEKLYILDGPPGSGQTLILKSLVEMAVELGLESEVYHCALDPKKYEHLWLPRLKTGVITSAWPHKYFTDEHCSFDTSTFLINNNLLFTETLKESRLVFLDLFERSINWLSKARKLHDELETYYSPSMDFKGTTQLQEKLLARILSSII
ncbi:MAG TPA: ATPase [Firmicutes bacterium]|nr:ATPase [Bacillota bacterium]HBT18010.1 ATPase [Bacillota bacterium]